MIETAESRWSAAARRAFRDDPPPPHLIVARLNKAPRESYVSPVGKASKPVVCARVNHGIWQAVCPFGCGAAQHASEDGLFYCAHCNNADTGHNVVPLVFPRHRAQIEEALAIRPLENRNWETDETVSLLRAENVVYHGREF